STATEKWGENSSSDHTNSTEDTYLDEGQPDYNMGAETLIRVGDDGSRINRTLIAFDFSNINITSSSQIVSATLYVKTYDAPDPGNVPVDLFKVKKDWYGGNDTWADAPADEADDEVTWSHQIYSETLWATPGCDGSADRETSSIGVQTFTTGDTWYSWDVTVSARNMYDNNQYYGWILRAQSEGTTKYWRIYSSEAANAANRPYLEIAYNSATPIFYSVGTDTSALYSGNASASSGILTLLGGPAADKIGVGDEVRVGSNRYYITGRNSSTEFT
ncbi:MAG: DNRLRE domain-containing protein, partial [Gammaproteobacteria bacterium]|nr:DNRLRE domain-containing protein [Gammaproteobacteria bacterium]